jgi:PII-like signaling protein
MRDLVWRQEELLRIFLGHSDRLHGEPVSDLLLRKARDSGLRGGTVLQGTAGFGAKSVIHKSSLFRMSSDLPVVVEFVDSAQRIETFLSTAAELLSGGALITREVIFVLDRGKK